MRLETLVENTEEEPKRRRRSSRKSSKQTYRRRRQLKILGYWLVIGAIGILIVTAIAILAGQQSGGGGE
jgi:preprotein translocase subunit Sec63